MELVFYKSKEYRDYYFIYKARNGVDPTTMLEKITHKGEHKESGYSHAEIEFSFILKAEATEDLLDYLIEHVATNHIENSDYDNVTFRSWYEFKDINNTDKWLDNFYYFQKQSKQELQKPNSNGIQTSLF